MVKNMLYSRLIGITRTAKCTSPFLDTSKMLCSGPRKKNIQGRRSTIPTCTTKIWCTSAVHGTIKRGTESGKIRQNIRTSSNGNIPVLCEGGGYHDIGGTQFHHIVAVKSRKHNNGKLRKFLNYAASYQDV